MANMDPLPTTPPMPTATPEQLAIMQERARKWAEWMLAQKDQEVKVRAFASLNAQDRVLVLAAFHEMRN